MTRTFNTRMVFRTMGALLLIEAIFMAIAMCVSLWYKEADTGIFLISTIITLLAGVIGLCIGRRAESRMGEREGYVIVAMVWVIFSAFGLLPYYLSGQVPTFTDAWFESMSGFTTTGATIIPDLNVITHGLLFWRSLTQWIGGMGIIVLSIAILPIFGLNGMQLYAAEVTGLTYEKLSPRISDTAKMMWTTYVVLTVTEILGLWLCGMPIFDAVCHSFSTIATGGFSTKNNSLEFYDSAAIHYLVAFYMFISGINFVILIYLVRGKARNFFRDEELRWYTVAVVIFALLLTIGLYVSRPGWTAIHMERSFRDSIFTVISAMTSTGYTISDYMYWPVVAWVVIFFLMLTGACAGSTAGGIKWVRLSIILKNGVAEFQRRIHPNAIIPVKLNEKVIPQQTINNIMAFLIFYVFIIVITVVTFSACGVNFDESIGAAVSAIGNVGISIGQFGPSGTYAEFPVVAKWVMSIVMLIGRLEIFTVLLLFTKVLWKK
ncbi:MAG: TrkH family potassium uptake protein [Paludibacteraceae bacterium]|nr:TrkH family potassium uptake protein [Paludibacteraceae bacterium]